MRFVVSPIFHTYRAIKPLWECLRSSFTFKGNHVIIRKEDNPSEKFVIFEEELDGIGNLEDLPRIVCIDKKCRNLIVFLYGDFTRSINQNRTEV